MFVRTVFTVLVITLQLSSAYAKEVGSITWNQGNGATRLVFSEFTEHQTRMITGATNVLSEGYPLYITAAPNARTVPQRLDDVIVGLRVQTVTSFGTFVVFEHKVYLLREGKIFDFDLPFSLHQSSDIFAEHAAHEDLIAFDNGGHTIGFVLKDGDLKMFETPIAPSAIRSMLYFEATDNVAINGSPADLAIFPRRMMKNPRPFGGQKPVDHSATPHDSSAADDLTGRAADFAAAAIEKDQSQVGNGGTVSIKDHVDLLLNQAGVLSRGTTFKDKNDKEADLVSYLRQNFSFIEKVQVNDIDLQTYSKEIALATTGLLMQQGGNVRVTGSPGVGKSHFETTLLAALLTKKNSPELTDRLYIKMSAADLSGGTKFVGSFEEKIRALKVLADHVPVVLMIDEIHSLVGAGTHASNNNDFFQYIKDDLATGKIKIVGMTTDREWEKHFSVDQALVERFSIHIKIEQPTPEKLTAILENFKITRHRDSKVSISHEQMSAIVQLATRFDPLGANPRKSIRLLDFILASAKVNGSTEVSADAIIHAASRLYNYDISSLTPDKIRDRIVDMTKHLDGKLVGMEASKDQVVKATAHYFVTQKSNGDARPYGVVLYGDRGAGKTALARATADGLGFKFNRIMMGDYASAHSADDFKTALAMAIQLNPFQVLLLDEIEKAHPSVQAVLLRVLDEGRLSAKLSPYASSETEIDASKLFIFAATNAARDLANVSHSPALFQETAERDGFNRYLIDRFKMYIALPQATLPSVFEIMKMKANEMLKHLDEAGYRVSVNVDELAKYLMGKVQHSTVEAHQNPIGFAFAQNPNHSANAPVAISVRDLERHLSDVEQTVSLHMVMANKHSAAIHFDSHGKLDVQEAAPICRDLFSTVH